MSRVRRATRFACLALLPAIGCGAGCATREETLVIEQHLRPLIDGAYATGVVAVVRREGEREAVALRAEGASEEPLPDGAATLFETGSIGKVFTGLLLAEAARRGEVAETTPVPDSWGVRAYAGQDGAHPIELWHLSTHTSGLPALPDNIDASLANPYEGYTRADMEAALSGIVPSTRPGGDYAYSNLALGLLGAVLADAGGAPYAGLLRERAFPALGVEGRAWTRLDDAVRARLAPGHAYGVPAEAWGAEDALAPSGCVVMSAGALLDAALAFRDAPPGTALHDTLRVRFPFPDGGGVALGWHVLDDGTRWHNGSTGGYHAFVAFHPERDVVLAVCANDASPQVTEASFRLYDALLGRPSAPLTPTPVVAWPAGRTASVVGRYVDPSSGLGLELRVDEAGRVLARLDGQAGYRVFPSSDDALRFRVVEAELRCAFGAGGACDAVALHQGGAVTRFERLATGQ